MSLFNIISAGFMNNQENTIFPPTLPSQCKLIIIAFEKSHNTI